MNRQILYITHEVLPGQGLPVGGGGIRSWSIGEGLKSSGHEVIYALPKEVVARIPNPSKDLIEYAFEPHLISEFINRIQPDILLFQQWPSAWALKNVDIPVVIDLHGSLLIENSYRHLGDFRTNALAKIRILENADYLTCAGERQKYYWWAWAVMCGMDPKDIPIGVIPVSLSPEQPVHHYPEEPVFVFGGVSWAWQDPTKPINALVDTLNQAQKGKLNIFVGKHPVHRIAGEKYFDLREYIPAGDRVVFSEMIEHNKLIDMYCHSSVAIDVMKRNTERELAFTTRTIEYLWCGLPVIYGDYLELSSAIKEYKAGWLVDPDDPDSVRKVTQTILEHPEIVKEYGQNAQKLVQDKFSWNKTIKPLDTFCREPVVRQKPHNILNLSIERIKELEKELWATQDRNRFLEEFPKQLDDLRSERDQIQSELNSTRHDLEAIRNKALFKAFKACKRLLKLE